MESGINIYAIQKKSVEDLNEQFPQIFSGSSVTLHQLCTLVELLGAKVHQVNDNVRSARFEVNNNHPYIYLNKENESIFKRLTLAHEIGHLYIYRYFPELYATKDINWHENFANLFSRELLVPISWRKNNLHSFKSTYDPKNILHYIMQVNVYLPWFIGVINNEFTWYHNYQYILIYASLKVNRFSNTEKKVRIVSRIFDKAKYYIPNNIGLDRLFSINDKIKNLRIAEPLSFSGTVKLLTARENIIPKFALAELKCEIRIIALRPTKFDNSSNYLLVIDPHQEGKIAPK